MKKLEEKILNEALKEVEAIEGNRNNFVNGMKSYIIVAKREMEKGKSLREYINYSDLEGLVQNPFTDGLKTSRFILNKKLEKSEKND